MHLLFLLLCVFLYLVGVIQAAPGTITNTTGNAITSDSFKAPSFTTRTIWSIVSSSVLTLFACIYSTIHPNIPSPKDSPNRMLLRRLGMMIMALIAPELIVTWAMRQWFSARLVTRKLKESGYFKESVFFVLMGGFMLYVDGKPCLTLRPDDILKLMGEECIDFPTLTARRIHNKSKGNAISKGLVMLQVAWFVMQLITCAIYRLETTQLEIGTLAFAVLNFLTYAVWWDKPLNVQCPHPVYLKSTKSRPEVCMRLNNHTTADYVCLSSSDRHKSHGFGIFSPVLNPIMELIIGTRSLMLRVPTFDGSIDLKYSDMMVLQFAALSMATIFGGIHCLAWFFTFITNQEQLLWRICALGITGTPWLFFGVTYVYPAVRGTIIPLFLDLITRLLCIILYITARAILLVLMFTTLRHLPGDAYQVVSSDVHSSA
ncbi:hypothetical protein EV424DRAFT_1319015 [Suillus variegatus]|nr:hypothetical protein EV424DRAFT_1319015 [Suillus variegatus]